MYCGIYTCGADYIDEMIRDSEIRWNEHITGKDKKFGLHLTFKQ